MSTSFSLSEYGSKAFPPPIPHRLESLRGPGDSNVVVRGFLLHGPHLGTSPSTMNQNLLPLLQAGVTCFVCMQQELPSVMTAQATQTRSTYGNNNVVTARPYIREAQALIDAPGSSLPNSGSPLSFVHCPIPPTGPGILDDASATKLCADLIAYMRAGELLYLHCGDGNGRSGTIACLLAGIVFNIGPVEAMALMQKSRNDRGGSQGPCPETHEQRMQVHRLLSDVGFRARVSAATPKRPETQRNESSAALNSVLLKIRGILAKKGIASLVYLRRYAIKLGHAAIVESGGHAPPPPSPIDTGAGVYLPRRAFDKFCADSQWFLTPDESAALFSAAVASSTSNNRDMVEVAPFFKLIRGPLSARRAATVHAAFARLGGDLVGSVNVDAIAKAFSAALHPDVKANKRTAAEVTSEFLDTFGMQVRTEVKGSGVGARALGLPTHRSVSAQEFEDYYADLSGAILDDSYFDLVVFGCFPTAANHLLSAASQAHNKANPHITASVGAASQADKRESIFAIAPPEKPFGGTLTFNGESRHSGRMRIQNANTNQVAESGALSATRPNTQGGGVGGGFNSGSGMRQMTDSGYSYVDRVTIDSSLKALHARLVRVGPFAMSYLGAMFRRHDNDRDGLIDLFEFRAALKDTVMTCASPHTGGGAASASVEHPLTISDTDSDAVFAAAIQTFSPETANSQRPVIPLEKFHQCLRGPLSRSRRAAVLSLFTQLDKDASGCIPIGHLMQSFRAEGHPVVHAGKATVTSIYRQFQDSFGEAFKYEDSAGAAGARFDPGAAGEAYRGYGDGMVRLPFFESWNEGIASLVGGGPSTNGEPYPSDSGSDNDFNLVSFSVWQAARASSNALSGGSNGPAFDARAMLQKSDDTESGILSSMQKLGSASRAGGQANVSSTAFEIGAGPGTRVGIARQQHVAAQQQQNQLGGVAGSSLVIPPTNRGGMAAAQPPQPPPSPSPATYAAQAARMIANRSTPNNSRFFSDELGVVTGGSGTNVGVRGGSRQLSDASASSSQSMMMDPELDSAIKMGRSILQRRGFRGGFQLLRSIELASGAVNGGQQQQQQQAPLGSALLPIPQKMMMGIIRDSGLGLSNHQLEIVASRFSAPKAFLDALFPQLSPTRMDIVRRAFDAVSKQASAQNAIINGSPALSVLQLSYLSARHPEVKSGKRSEEDVLREFLATFSGPTIVDGEGDNAFVTFDGFCTYYTIVSFFVIEDATFTTQLFDTWSLFSMPSTEGAAGLAYNLYGSGYEGFEGTGKRHSPKKEAEQRSSVSEALGQGPGYSRAMHLRGPGQDHPPPSAYQGGYGIENKRDFSAARPGWGIERF